MTSEKKDLKSERQHVNKALNVCKYPKWTIRKVAKNLSKRKDKIKKAISGKKDSNGNILLPYIKGKAETLKRVFNKHKINVCFKPHQTLRDILFIQWTKLRKRKCADRYTTSSVRVVTMFSVRKTIKVKPKGI